MGFRILQGVQSPALELLQIAIGRAGNVQLHHRALRILLPLRLLLSIDLSHHLLHQRNSHLNACEVGLLPTLAFQTPRSQIYAVKPFFSTANQGDLLGLLLSFQAISRVAGVTIPIDRYSTKTFPTILFSSSSFFLLRRKTVAQKKGKNIASHGPGANRTRHRL